MIENKNIKELKMLKEPDLLFRRPRSFYFSFFKGFYKKNRFLFFLTLSLIISQTIIELLLLIFSRNNPSSFLNSKQLVLFFLLLVLLFIFFSYFSLKKEKTLSVYLTNEVRRRIVSFYLNTAENKINNFSQADLIAKVSYHLPLLSSFVTRVFFAIIRWFFYFCCFVFIAFLLNFNVLYSFLIFLFLSLSIFFISYFISRYYISKEVTFYSQIIKHISFNSADKFFLKRFGGENHFFSKFDRLVEFDSYFRIRRDLWFRLANKMIFLLVIIIYFLINFWREEISYLFLQNGFNYLFLIFLIMYVSRSLYEISMVGLYSFPARLGILLSILPKKPSRQIKEKDIKKVISFHNRKTKIFYNSNYFRRLSFDFELGKRYLFFGDNFSGKTSLAMSFAGLKTVNPMSWKVEIDGEKFEYAYWSKFKFKPYFFDPNFKSSRSLIEFISSKDKEYISMSEIERNVRKVQSFDLIVKNLIKDGNYNVSLETILNNTLKSFALHCAYCLINKPRLIIIDNLWLDLNYPPINQMLELLDSELKNSAIIVFAGENCDKINYYKKYEITSREINEK